MVPGYDLLFFNFLLLNFFFSERSKLFRGMGPTAALARFHQLKALRLLRQLRQRTQKHFSGIFDQTFDDIPEEKRTITIYRKYPISLTITLNDILAPVLHGTYFNEGDETTIPVLLDEWP
jgi:hypothetical protein